MLLIREAQIQALSANQVANFILEMASRLRTQFHNHLAPLSDDDLHGRIAHAITRASALGINRRIDVARYLNLSVAAGWDFERDPQYSFIAAALCEDPASDPSSRVAEACGRMQHRLELAEATA